MHHEASHAGADRFDFANAELIMEREVDHIVGKQLALEAATRMPGVAAIVDRLRVRMAPPMGDGDIRDKVRDVLLEEIPPSSCTIRVCGKGQLEVVRRLADAVGTFDVRVEDGVVMLVASVPRNRGEADGG